MLLQKFFDEVLAVTAAGKTGNDAQFEMYLEAQGYFHVRKLDDGTWVALTPLIFTTGLCMGIDSFGYEKRYCYDNHGLSISEIKKIQSGADVPQGWIAKRERS